MRERPTAPEDGAGRARGETTSGESLTADEARQVAELAARDVEVRAHEAAHVAASGGLGGAPSFDYATGPDGKRYAVGGEVSVDTSPGRTPEETIARARSIRAAATAPADPSSQDMAVAASAARMEAEAQRALQQQRRVDAGRAPGVGGAVDGAEGPVAGTASARSERGARATAAPGAPSSADARLQAAADDDRERMLAALTRERASARGGAGHSHEPSGCGFCRKAVGAYR